MELRLVLEGIWTTSHWTNERHPAKTDAPQRGCHITAASSSEFPLLADTTRYRRFVRTSSLKRAQSCIGIVCRLG
ncbi:unnamed protein product [Protopolystoma xenopodis]|uniref:Uncharacterized protein n=1 Tax=Protopolystoma xenopodis TaxID=117903 RepID=A0A3S5CQR3_9PLAT|nr:unnamed protein product [Protopolystoma xenopodis]